MASISIVDITFISISCPTTPSITVSIYTAYGVVISNVSGLGTAPSGTFPISSGSKTYTVSSTIPAGTVTVITDTAAATTAKLDLFVNGSLVSCVNISAAGIYQLTLPSNVNLGSTISLNVDGGSC